MVYNVTYPHIIGHGEFNGDTTCFGRSAGVGIIRGLGSKTGFWAIYPFTDTVDGI